MNCATRKVRQNGRAIDLGHQNSCLPYAISKDYHPLERSLGLGPRLMPRCITASNVPFIYSVARQDLLHESSPSGPKSPATHTRARETIARHRGHFLQAA